MSLRYTNLNDLIENIPENEVSVYLRSFLCRENSEIEGFLHNNALDFAKRKMASTYLIVDDNENIVAYYTLAHKAVEIPADRMSLTTKKRLARFSQFDEEKRSFTVSAFLIAQFGRSSSFSKDVISGDRLMDTALEVFHHVQYEVGGSLVYLECEDNSKLLSFYQNEHNHYVLFGERISQKENITYKQLLRFI